MKKNDLMVAADRALSLLASMSDDALMLALEQCDTSLAYAVNCYAGRDMYSFAATNLHLPSGAESLTIDLRKSKIEAKAAELVKKAQETKTILTPVLKDLPHHFNAVHLPNLMASESIEAPGISPLDQINVRRLLDKIKKSISTLIKPHIFELNDKITRDQITASIESYLESLKISDYTVICNDSNNPMSRIDAGELCIDLCVKIKETDEFIYLPVTNLCTTIDIWPKIGKGSKVEKLPAYSSSPGAGMSYDPKDSKTHFWFGSLPGQA